MFCSSRAVALLLIATLLSACSGLPSTSGSAAPAALADSEVTPSPEESTPEEGVSPSPSPSAPAPKVTVFRPAPDRWIANRPGPLARQFKKVTRAIDRSVRRWIEEGNPSREKPPRALVLQTLYQQRMYRKMTAKPKLARRTQNRLGGRMRAMVRGNVFAGTRLRSMIKTPLSPDATLRVGGFRPAGELLRYYKKAQRRFGVHWQVLASINMIESKFGRVKSTSWAGAQGPMQFMPPTWDAYGMGGDVRDPHDAIMGAANYLRASGAPDRYRSAVWNYNHSYAYVDAVMAYARRMMAQPREFYAYYNWQVYILTTAGDKRLTGPGL